MVEVVGGLVSGSLALLADAGHMLTDVAGLALALFAIRVAARPPTPERTFGFLRVEALAAFANAALLLLVAAGVVVEAVRRLTERGPGRVRDHARGRPASAWPPTRSRWCCCTAGQAASLNLRGAYLEVLGDLLGSAAVVVAAIVIAVTGLDVADVVASLLVAALIAPRAVSLARAAVDVLLESAPRGMDLAQVRAHIGELDRVVDVHDLHAWTLGTGVPVLSAHVVVEDVLLPRRVGPAAARPAAVLPFRTLRRGALDVPARGRRSRRARGAHPPVTHAPRGRAGRDLWPADPAATRRQCA